MKDLLLMTIATILFITSQLAYGRVVIVFDPDEGVKPIVVIGDD